MVRHFFKQKNTQISSGFTVIELMVTITIVVLVTAVVLVQYSAFNSSVLLNSQAYKIAFDLREAQSLGLGSRGQGTEFREEYGLYFNKTSGNENKYILFQDNGSAVPAGYAAAEALGSPNVIDPRFKISNICVSAGTAPSCVAGTSAVNSVSITFKRPDFNAQIFSSIAGVQTVDIYITSVSDPTSSKIVHVSTSGQITVQ